MIRSLKVSDVMWSHIEPVRMGTQLNEVVKHLLANHVTGLPVVDAERRVIGFVSEQDCIHSMLVSSYHCEGSPIVDDVMFREPIAVTPDMAIVDLAQQLVKGKPKVYPVVDHGVLKGIVTRSVILSEMARVGCGIDVPRYAMED